MKVLIVSRSKAGRFAAFVEEQVAELRRQGITCVFFPVKRKGFGGYIRYLPELNRLIRSSKPDLIHAHYGLCGLLANLQRKIPVVTTYHGSDINDPKVLRLSKIAIHLSRFNIFVSQKIVALAKPGKNSALVPCGVNLVDYPVIDKAEARNRMGLLSDGKYVLFSGAFDNPVKNAPLAKSAIHMMPGVELIELKGFTRSQVATLMQAVDCLLMTSHSEGSPQVIKEALACGCPIVSVDVGDVKQIVGGVGGCFIADRTPQDIMEKVDAAFLFGRRTNGREVVQEKGLTNDRIAKRIIDIYQMICQ